MNHLTIEEVLESSRRHEEKRAADLHCEREQSFFEEAKAQAPAGATWSEILLRAQQLKLWRMA